MTPEPYRNHTTTAQREHHYGPIVSMDGQPGIVMGTLITAGLFLALFGGMILVGVMAHG